MRYHCNDCNADFNESTENKSIQSSLVRTILLTCPKCGNKNIVLSEHGKILLDRKTKIKKIESKYHL